MLPILKTFIYSFIGTILVPWISSKFGFQITSDQTTTLQTLAMGGLVSAGAALSHLTHVKAAAATSTTKISAHWMATVIAIVLAVGMLSMLSACAAVSSFFGSPTGNAVVTAAVDVAVATAEQKGVTAAQINGVAKIALAADTGATATASAISGVLNTQLAKLNLPAGDMAAVQVLEIAFSAALVAKIGSNTTVAAAQADIATLLNQVVADTGG